MIILLGDNDMWITEDPERVSFGQLGRLVGGDMRPAYHASYIIYSGSRKPGMVYYFKSRDGLTGWQPESTLENIELNPESGLV